MLIIVGHLCLHLHFSFFQTLSLLLVICLCSLIAEYAITKRLASLILLLSNTFLLSIFSILSEPDEGYSRNVLCALNFISTFLTSGKYYIHQEMEIKMLTLERHKYMAALDWLMGSQSLFSIDATFRIVYFMVRHGDERLVVGEARANGKALEPIHLKEPDNTGNQQSATPSNIYSWT